MPYFMKSSQIKSPTCSPVLPGIALASTNFKSSKLLLQYISILYILSVVQLNKLLLKKIQFRLFHHDWNQGNVLFFNCNPGSFTYSNCNCDCDCDCDCDCYYDFNLIVTLLFLSCSPLLNVNSNIEMI